MLQRKKKKKAHPTDSSVGYREKGGRRKDRFQPSCCLFFCVCVTHTTRHDRIERNEATQDMTHLPDVLWAQRTDRILLTIEVPDCERPVLDVGNVPDGTGYVKFRGTNQTTGNEYELELELYGRIDPNGNKMRSGGRNVFLSIQKESEGPHWPRLTHSKEKRRNVHCDWNKWKDEDEEDEPGTFTKLRLEKITRCSSTKGSTSSSFSCERNERGDGRAQMDVISKRSWIVDPNLSVWF